MTPQPEHGVVILATWAANRAARHTPARRSCTGCPWLSHLPALRIARCMWSGGALIAHDWQDNDAAPSWCALKKEGA